MSIGETITQPLGPLPLWGWAVAIGGTVLIVRATRKGGTSNGTTGTTGIGTGTGGDGTDGTNGTDGTDGAEGPVGPKGDPGEQGDTGGVGPTGPTGPAGQFPNGYTKLLNDIFNWVQQYDRSQNYKNYLRDKIDSGTLNAADKARAQADLTHLNGTTQKFTATYGTSRGTVYYGLSYINTTINNLQTQLGRL